MLSIKASSEIEDVESHIQCDETLRIDDPTIYCRSKFILKGSFKEFLKL